MNPCSSLLVLRMSLSSLLQVFVMSPGSSLHVLGMSQGGSRTGLLGLMIPNTFDETQGVIPNTCNINLIFMNL